MNLINDISNIFNNLDKNKFKDSFDIFKNMINNFEANYLKKIEIANSLKLINNIKIEIFGKKGAINIIFKNMTKLNNKERPILGKILHDLKSNLENKIHEKIIKINEIKKNINMEKDIIDISMPGFNIVHGNKHPLTIIEDKIKKIFIKMGYIVIDGFEIEEDYYNFKRLNIPKNHPARDMQDTFYIDENYVLRTHTSPVQARIMEKLFPKVPIKVISPGKVFRKDYDSTHSPMFHQIEGLYIDKKVTFSNLKGTLFYFLKEIFGEKRKTRLRPSYFPFTEPSGEIDVSCEYCFGKGCKFCSYSGWLEILGCGMVHPNVLKMSGYDSKKVNGFAFGMGIERIAMLKFGIKDIRLFYENDKRFLKQFGGI